MTRIDFKRGELVRPVLWRTRNQKGHLVPSHDIPALVVCDDEKDPVEAYLILLGDGRVRWQLCTFIDPLEEDS